VRLAAKRASSSERAEMFEVESGSNDDRAATQAVCIAFRSAVSSW
jgi:hypothetical protein